VRAPRTGGALIFAPKLRSSIPPKFRHRSRSSIASKFQNELLRRNSDHRIYAPIFIDVDVRALIALRVKLRGVARELRGVTRALIALRVSCVAGGVKLRGVARESRGVTRALIALRVSCVAGGVKLRGGGREVAWWAREVLVDGAADTLK
jgi:hypothetical protein